jgi:hypothetical protein
MPLLQSDPAGSQLLGISIFSSLPQEAIRVKTARHSTAVRQPGREKD